MRTFHLALLILPLIVPTMSSATLVGVAWLGSAWQVDPATAQATVLGSTGFSELNALAKLDGNLLTSDTSGNLIEVDPTTGIGHAVATIDLGGAAIDIRSMAVSPAGQLYVGQRGLPATGLWLLDPSSGVGTLVGSMTEAPQAMDFRADGTLFGWDALLGLVRIDTSNGALTDVSGTVAGPIMQSIVFAPDGSLLGISQPTGGLPEYLYQIDIATGVPTLIAMVSPGTGIRGMAFVPEPSTAALCLAALALLAWHVHPARRRIAMQMRG